MSTFCIPGKFIYVSILIIEDEVRPPHQAARDVDHIQSIIVLLIPLQVSVMPRLPNPQVGNQHLVPFILHSHSHTSHKKRTCKCMQTQSSMQPFWCLWENLFLITLNVKILKTHTHTMIPAAHNAKLNVIALIISIYNLYYMKIIRNWQKKEELWYLPHWRISHLAEALLPASSFRNSLL